MKNLKFLVCTFWRYFPFLLMFSSISYSKNKNIGFFFSKFIFRNIKYFYQMQKGTVLLMFLFFFVNSPLSFMHYLVELITDWICWFWIGLDVEMSIFLETLWCCMKYVDLGPGFVTGNQAVLKFYPIIR